MVETNGQQNDQSQGWQKADARILGQILAAQNVVFALPDTIHIAEFYAQTLLSIPGIIGCRVCLGNKSIQAGEMQNSACGACETLRSMDEKEHILAPVDSNFQCNLMGQSDIRIITIDSYQHHFGFFVSRINNTAAFDVYHPFIHNLSSYVAVILENRLQKDWLQKARDELERKVEDRTHDLMVANEELDAARLTALDIMQEAVEARQRAEQANTELQREVVERKRAEQALRESEELLRVTLTNILDPVFITDNDGKFTFICANVLSALGYSREEMQAMGNISRLLGNGLFDHEELEMRGEIADIERLIVDNFGRQRIFIITVKRVSIREGTRLYTLHDITKRKQAEEALRESETKFRAVFENSVDAIGVSKAGIHTFVNPAYLALFGYADNAELVGKPILDLIAPNHREQVLENIRRRASGQPVPTVYETRGLRKDGSEFDMDVHVSAYELNGEVYTVPILRDITERKQAEEALRASERKLGEAVQIAQVGYWERDYIAETISLSDEARQIFGLPLQKPFPKLAEWHTQWLKLIHLEDQPKVMQVLTDALAGGPPYNVDYRVVRPDGEVRYVHSYAELTRDEAGKPLRMFGTMIDITERKRTEEEIRRLNQELEQRVVERTLQLESANKELEAFAYSVSHDLRAPLRHIDGFIALLQNQTASVLDDQSQHYMDMIAESAKKMGFLIDDLLSFSRMGRNDMVESQVDLNELVREVVQEARPETEGRNIRWEIASLPVVTGNRAMLKVVLTNLISNALKFTRPRQQAEIEIGCVPDQKEEVGVFVRDNGVGFNMDYVDKLFGVFQRLHRADEFEGTGIGLANVRRIISRHGGRTWAESEIDHGTTIYFSLPKSNA